MLYAPGPFNQHSPLWLIVCYGRAGFSQACQQCWKECSKGLNKQAVHFGDNGQCLQAGRNLWNPDLGLAPGEALWAGRALCFVCQLNELENTIGFPGCENCFKGKWFHLASGRPQN